MLRAALAAAVLTAVTAIGCSAQVQLKAESAPPPPRPAKVEPKPEPPAKPKYITISERIEFTTGRAELMPNSRHVLDEVADVLRDNPGIKSVEIEGHTDDTGTHFENMQLSQQRAETVRDYLVTKGVSEGRLTPKGYGFDQPIADNGTAEGRKQNRRVQFRIVDQDG
jgi:OmpA-OmpF porin, OOP family